MTYVITIAYEAGGGTRLYDTGIYITPSKSDSIEDLFDVIDEKFGKGNRFIHFMTKI